MHKCSGASRNGEGVISLALNPSNYTNVWYNKLLCLCFDCLYRLPHIILTFQYAIIFA